MQKQIVYRPCPTADLKELEINGFVKRVVHAQAPVVLEYQLTPYADTLSGSWSLYLIGVQCTEIN